MSNKEESPGKESPGNEQERKSGWAPWYPPVVPEFPNIPLTESPYGPPNEKTLNLFASLPKGSNILDIGGGDGRYAVHLAEMGHNVFVVDIDEPHINRLQEKTELLKHDAGTIGPIMADATKPFPFKSKSFDGALNAGFGYLMPPDEFDIMFKHTANVLKSDGLFVFEFATNRNRREKKSSEESLIGKKEYNYSFDKGQELLRSSYDRHGFSDVNYQNITIHFEEPYYFHSDLIIASGKKQ
jgi:SAM-dependent methyltransferase